MFFKTQKALEILQAENVMLKLKIMRQDIAKELDKVSGICLGKARLPQGEFFDPSYQVNPADQLSHGQGREKAARDARKGKSQAVCPPEVSNYVSMQVGPSRSFGVNDSLIECVEVEL